MSTTSLKVPDNLKARVMKVATDTGKSAHAFMLDAIAEHTERVEESRALLARAEASLKSYQETGIGYDADEVHHYLRAKIQGLNPAKLQPIKR
jgi:predicted transcriptional regulator